MKFAKAFFLLVILGSTAVTGVTLVKVIGVQREIGAKQAGLLKGLERQNGSIVEICGAFKPTEEMVGKTRSMLADLRQLAGVVRDMNGLVGKATDLQGKTAGLLDASNGVIGGLCTAVGAASAPLTAVGEKTSRTLVLINRTVAALSSMAGAMGSTNSCAADIANFMEGGY
ncbi:MAG: hypothetical protein KKF41_10425 [Actinobacteria bacterium]|nr:hypothetical protein [Actinomycetota bacterium]MBU1943064.1 hypothetical protein [Actinomycetota bacterium]MBU2687989.1 hypothetical protein [Actinomycetota bacterium]